MSTGQTGIRDLCLPPLVWGFFSKLDSMNEESVSFTTSFIKCKNHSNKLRTTADSFKMLISWTQDDVGEKHIPKNVTNWRCYQLLNPVEKQTDFKNGRKNFSCFMGGRGWVLYTMDAKYAFDANRNKYMNQRNQVHVINK